MVSLQSIALAVTLASAATALASCGTPPESRARAKHLVFLTVDTLQTDRLSSYGGPNACSPNVDRLASEGLRVANAFTPRGLTLPSFASIFTSKYPPEHGMLDNTFTLRESEELLAEHLDRAGFRNRAFVSNGMLQPLRNNVEQGFELASFTFEPDELEMTRQALAYVRDEFGRSAQREFLWIHWFNPHKPYLPPAQFSRPFLDPEYSGEFDGTAASLKRIFVDKIELTPADLRHILGHYDGAVRFVDDCIGQVLEALQATGRARETLVVFAADHGEELYAHNHYFYHANSVYRSVTSVPLVFHQPGVVPPGGVLEEMVSSLDLMPTVLSWLDVAVHPGPGNALRGRDLSALLRGEAPVPQEFAYVFHDDDIHVIRSREWCYVANPMGVTPHGPPQIGHYPVALRELYDLASDRNEQVNVVDEHPEVVERLASELERFRASLVTVEPYRGTQEDLMIPRLRELAELGYIEYEDVERFEAEQAEDH